MNLIKDFRTTSAYTYFKNDKWVDRQLAEGISDEELITQDLDRQYPENDYFFLNDYIEDGNQGFFWIRVWEK